MVRSQSGRASRSRITFRLGVSYPSAPRPARPISRDCHALLSASGNVLPMDITSPTAFICVVSSSFTLWNFSKLNRGIRSEEHTSELQSRGHLVCRLLLEKKNVPDRYYLDADGGTGIEPETVKLIEITKLTDEKKGDGEREEVTAFEGNNLIFV